jgi:hypothetical protein
LNVGSREVNTYSELWHASDCVFDAGRKAEQGSAWQFLSSLILTAFALEAFLNHAGSQVCENWSDLERLAPLAKLNHLRLHLTADLGPTGERPRQTLNELMALRNTLAHGRSETLEPKPTVRIADSSFEEFLHKRPLTVWEEKINSPDFAARAREDVERVIAILHDARPEPKEPLFSFGVHSSFGQLEG